jgi:hypothetical protein
VSRFWWPVRKKRRFSTQFGRAAVKYRLRGFGLSASFFGSSIKLRLAMDG